MSLSLRVALLLSLAGCAMLQPSPDDDSARLSGAWGPPPPESAPAQFRNDTTNVFCRGQRLSLADLVYRADFLAEDALAVLGKPDQRQGCVTRALLVAGRLSSPKGTLAIIEYVESEVGRYDPDRMSFRSENVGYAIGTLGFRLGRIRAERPNDDLETHFEYRCLLRLLDPRWLSISPPAGRLDDSSSRRETVAREAYLALYKYLDGRDRKALLARVQTMPTVHQAVRRALRQYPLDGETGVELGPQ